MGIYRIVGNDGLPLGNSLMRHLNGFIMDIFIGGNSNRRKEFNTLCKPGKIQANR
jgi:hypothetical protein